MTRLLFINNPPRQCGVHSYGAATIAALRKSTRLELRYVELPEDTVAPTFLSVVEQQAPEVIVYNWHCMIMNWLNDDLVAEVRRQFPGIPQLGIAHDYAPPFPLLSAVIHLDPTFDETYREFRVRRLVPEFAPAQTPADNIIGWFGFAARRKGVVRVIEQVNAEFDDAVLRLHIPFGYYGDQDGRLALNLAEECRQLAKPGIRVEITHDYKTKEQLLEWLSGNSVNCFLYDDVPGAGIASTIDYALAARRPIAVSDSNLFRHIIKLCPSVRLAGRSLKQIIHDGFAPLEPLRREWCEAALMADYERVVETVVGRARAIDLTSNRVLTPADRDALRPVVDEMRTLEADIMSRKLPGAVFQNAFIFEQVRLAARAQDDILLVGGFEDPIGPALQKLGHRVRITDPQIDGHQDHSLWVESLLKTDRHYDIIVSCSVIEHVPNDVSFIYHLYHLLKPGGIAFLTADFFQDLDEDAPSQTTTLRLYDCRRLANVVKHIPAGSLLDAPTWGPIEPYFTFADTRYGFCSIAFRKPVHRLACEVIPEDRLLQEIRSLKKQVDLQQSDIEIQREQIESLIAQRDELAARFAVVNEAGPLTLKVAANMHKVLKRLPVVKTGVKKLLRARLPKKG